MGLGKMHIQESMIRQKSRCRWLKDDDQNSRFFHSFIKSIFHRNGISILKVGATLVQDIEGIK